MIINHRFVSKMCDIRSLIQKNIIFEANVMFQFISITVKANQIEAIASTSWLLLLISHSGLVLQLMEPLNSIIQAQVFTVSSMYANMKMRSYVSFTLLI